MIFLLVILTVIIPLVNLQEFAPMAMAETGDTQEQLGWQRNLQVEGVFYDLYFPSSSPVGSILVLPGWNFPRTSWIENSDLEVWAKKYNYALILPEMGKSIYASQYYDETSLKWHPELPGGKFIKDIFIPEMQAKHQLLLPGDYNTMLGLSTGGRGVALIALENPNLFQAGGSLSGDFNQTNMRGDNLMTAVYGPFNQFRERWVGHDNPQNRAREWRMPLFLAHGTADTIVPETQSRDFYQKLRAIHGDTLNIEYHAVEDAKHDYDFWNSQLPMIFEFFESVRQDFLHRSAERVLRP